MVFFYNPVEDTIIDAKKIGTVQGGHKGLLRVEFGIHDDFIFFSWGYLPKGSSTGIRDKFIVKVNMKGEIVGNVISLSDVDVFVTRVISCGDNLFAIEGPDKIFNVDTNTFKFNKIDTGNKDGFWNDALCTNDNKLLMTWWEEDITKSKKNANLTILDTKKMSYNIIENIFIKSEKSSTSGASLSLKNQYNKYKIFMHYVKTNSETNVDEYNINIK